MARIVVQIKAAADVTQATAAIQQLNAALASNAAALASAAATNKAGFVDQQNAFRQAVRAGGAYEVQTMRIRSESALMTDAINKQRVSMKQLHDLRGQAAKSMKGEANLLNQLTNEQMRLKNATAVSWSRDSSGRIEADLITPIKDYTKNAGFAAEQTRVLQAATIAAANEQVRLGKSMQWTGRQLSYATTLPIAAIFAGVGVAAYQVDKEMTRLLKVYGDVGEDTSAVLENVRAEVTETSQVIAREFGVAAKASIGLAADLAAAGFEGSGLTTMMKEATRLMTLGDIDQDQAVEVIMTLGNAFGITTEQLGFYVDKMNAVESETITTIQDLAEAIPRAGGVISQLGGTVDDLNVMLVALRQNGFTAAEGANALRASLGKILAPDERTLADLEKLGIDIIAIRDAAEGNPIEMLQALGKQLESMSNIEEVTVLRELFDIYQYGRMQALVKGLREMDDATTQVGEAAAIANKSAEELAANSAKELDRLVSAPSKRIVIAVQTIIAELAEAGRPILSVVASVLGGIAQIVTAFGALPGPIKAIGASMLIITAIVGPMTYLVGVAKAFNAQIQLWKLRMQGVTQETTELLTPEAQLRKLVSDSTAAFQANAQAVDNLETQLKQLNVGLDMYIQNVREANATSMNLPGVARVDRSGPTPRVNGRFASEEAAAAAERNNAVIMQQHKEKMLDQTKEQAKTEGAVVAAQQKQNNTLDEAAPKKKRLSGLAEKFRGNIMNSVFAITGLVSVLGLANGGLGTALNTVLTIAMVSSMLGLRMNLFGKGISGAASKAGHLAKVIGFNVRMAGALGIAMKGVLGPIGIAIALLGAAAWLQNRAKKKTEEHRKEMENLEGTVGRTAKLFNIEPADDLIKPGTIDAVKRTRKEMDELRETQKKWREENEAAYKRLRRDESYVDERGERRTREGADEKTQDQEIVRLFVDSARVLGDVEKAKELVRESLAAAGWNEYQINAKLNGMDLDLATVDADIDKQLKGIEDKMLSTKDKIGVLWMNNPWDWDDGALDSFGKEASDAAYALGEDLAKSYNSGQSDQFKRGLKKVWEPVHDDLREQMGKVRESLENRPQDAALITKALGSDEWTKDTDKGNRALAELIWNYEEVARSGKALPPAIMAAGKAMDDQRRKVDSLLKALVAEGVITQAVADELIVLTDVNKDVDQAMLDAKNAADKEKNAINGVGDAAAYTTEYLHGMADASDEAKRSMTQDFVNSFKGNVEGRINDAVDFALDAYDEETEGLEKAMDERQEAQEEALDAREERSDEHYEREEKALSDSFDAREKAEDEYWEGREKALDDAQEAEVERVESAYDARIEAIEKVMEAEEQQEEARKEMFEAAKRRLQRMSEMANANIDFNLAFNSGELDEAARISNSMMTQTQEWNIEDAQRGAETEYEKNRTAQEAKIDDIEKEKEARLDALEKVQEAEREALEAERERAAERLRIERETAEAALEARRQASQKAFEAERDALEKTHEKQRDTQAKMRENTRQRMADEYAALIASVPATEEQYNILMGKIQAGYRGTTGVAVFETSKWKDEYLRGFEAAFADTQTEVKDKAIWEQIGATIGAATTQGLLGMDFGQFANWMKTGQLPNMNGRPGTATHTQQIGPNGMPQGGGRHSGGTVDSMRGDRAGRPMNAPLYPDEVPIIAQKGEYVVQRKAVQKVGRGFLDAVNHGALIPDVHHGGGMVGEYRHSGGMTGTIGAAAGAGLMKTFGDALNLAVRAGAERNAQELYDAGKMNQIPSAMFGGMMGAIAGQAGRYGNSEFNAEQLANAAAIIGVGRGMGATERDLIIALMTAMQESTLRNLAHGDRDSVGLFQQRPSQGWGTVQDIMNPQYAARKFFEALFKVGNRDSLSLTRAAQAVQRSAFPDAYAKWEDEARAILSGTGAGGGGSYQWLTGAPAWAMAGGAGPAGGDGFAGHLTAQQRQIRPDVLARVWQGLAMVPGQQLITSGLRVGSRVAGSGRTSLHASGQAADIGALAMSMGGSAQSEAMGDEIARVFRSGIIPGVREVLWKTWTGGNHFNHVHVGFNHGGGPVLDIPSLNTGGLIMKDGIAQVHKDEAIITAPLTQQLKKSELDSGTNVQYNITVNAGTNATADDIADAAIRKIQMKELRQGRTRRIGGNS